MSTCAPALLSVGPHGTQLDSDRTYLRENLYTEVFLKSPDTVNLWLKLDHKSRHFTGIPTYVYDQSGY